MKHISKMFLVIMMSLFLINPSIVQAGAGEEIGVDVDGNIVENVGSDNKEYPMKDNIQNDDKVKADSRQFITFKTKDEKLFYLIIDHSKEQDNVKLLTDVKESDLESLVKEKEKTPVIKNEEPKLNTNNKENEIKQEEIKKEESKPKNNNLIYYILGGVGLLIVGVGYYLKVIKPKKDKNKPNIEEEEDDDFFSESEEDNTDKE